MIQIGPGEYVNVLLDEVTGFFMLIPGSNQGIKKAFIGFVQFMAGGFVHVCLRPGKVFCQDYHRYSPKINSFPVSSGAVITTSDVRKSMSLKQYTNELTADVLAELDRGSTPEPPKFPACDF